MTITPLVSVMGHVITAGVYNDLLPRPVLFLSLPSVSPLTGYGSLYGGVTKPSLLKGLGHW